MNVTAAPAESTPVFFSIDRRVMFFRAIVVSPLCDIPLYSIQFVAAHAVAVFPSARVWLDGFRSRIPIPLSFSWTWSKSPTSPFA